MLLASQARDGGSFRESWGKGPEAHGPIYPAWDLSSLCPMDTGLSHSAAQEELVARFPRPRAGSASSGLLSPLQGGDERQQHTLHIQAPTAQAPPPR